MHLLIVCEEFPPAPHGGTGSSYQDLAYAMTAAGHKVSVVGISTTEDLRSPRTEVHGGVEVHRMPRSPAFLGSVLGAEEERWRLMRKIKEIHRMHRVDLVEASDYNGWLSRGVGLRNVSSVVRIRGSNLFFDWELGRDSSPVEKRHEYRSLCRADHLASVSEYAGRRTLEIAGLSQRECQVIPNAIDTDWFSPGSSGEREHALIVFVNSISERKGVCALLKAFEIVLRKFPASRLVLVGACGTGGSNPFLEQSLGQIAPDVRECVSFTGRVARSEVRDWLRRAAVCCYPSLMETFGIAALEAMSVGRPTVFTRLGPGPEIVEHGRTGLLCDPRQPSEIAACLERFLQNREFAEEVGRTAREEVLNRFSLAAWTKKNVDFYRHCVSSSATG